MICLQKLNYPVIGGIPDGHTVHRLQTCNEVTGIRQLCNMLSKISYVTPEFDSFGNAVTGFAFCPSGNFEIPNGSFPLITQNYLLIMMQIFRYYRGGVRLSVMTDSPAKIYSEAQFNYYQLNTSHVALAYTGFPNNMWSIYSAGSQAQHYHVNNFLMPYDVTLPYMSRYNCMPITMDNTGTGSLYVDLDTIYVSLVCNPTPATSSTFANVAWYLGGADDFLLGFQLGVPQATWSNPSFAVKEPEKEPPAVFVHTRGPIIKHRIPDINDTLSKNPLFVKAQQTTTN